MHRIDLARATAKPLDLDPDHDGRIVADIVAEWASTHGEPFTLTLGGPAGGQFRPEPAVSTSTWTPSSSAASWPSAGHGTGILRHPLPL